MYELFTVKPGFYNDKVRVILHTFPREGRVNPRYIKREKYPHAVGYVIVCYVFTKVRRLDH